MIRACPAATAVTRPLAVTVATLGLAEVHATSWSRGWLSESTTRAVSWRAMPTGTVSSLGEIETERICSEPAETGSLTLGSGHEEAEIAVTAITAAVTERWIGRIKPPGWGQSAARPA